MKVLCDIVLSKDQCDEMGSKKTEVAKAVLDGLKKPSATISTNPTTPTAAAGPSRKRQKLS